MIQVKSWRIHVATFIQKVEQQSAALTVNEAAAYLRISRAGIYRLFSSGELARTRIGGRTLVRRVDADALLNRSVEVSPAVAA
jgi:excisionase family DNA binding protein